MSSQLKTGIFTIVNKSSGQAVGRALAEDRSLLPKQIISYPADAKAHDKTQWAIEVIDGKYELKIEGVSTFAKEQLVFADLLRQSTEHWRITAQFHHGDNTYIIEKGSGDAGWVLENAEDGSQVACRALIVGLSLPPFFPPSQLWVILPVDD